MHYDKYAIRKSIRDFDLYKYLNSNNVDLNVRSEGKYYYVRCWHCGKHKLFIHSSNDDNYKGYWRCWVCGAKGDLFDIVANFDSIPRAQAFGKIVKTGDYTEVRPLLNLELKKWAESNKIIINKPIDLPLNFYKIWESRDSVGYNYMLGRGITEDLMQKFDIRYNHLMRRVIFPIYHRGNVVGWQARAVHESMQPKLMSSSGFRKTHALYNFDNVHNNQFVTIVEGPIDAIKAHRYNGVALLGKTMSEEQFKLLLRMPNLKKVYVALDPDASKEAQSMIIKLAEIWDVWWVRFAPDKDMGDCNQSEVDYYINSAKRYKGKPLIL